MSQRNFGFPVHLKVIFKLYHSLLSQAPLAAGAEVEKLSSSPSQLHSHGQYRGCRGFLPLEVASCLELHQILIGNNICEAQESVVCLK